MVRPLAGHSKAPLAIDLFCGAGGMTVGLKQAGFSVIGAIDIDPVAVETYLKNHKKCAVWQGDIRKLDGTAVLKELRIQVGELDLLAGCPPCQGFSRMRTRNRKSVRDRRNTLVDEFLRLVRELRPKTVMMENVPRLRRYPRLASMVRELRRSGYHVDHGVVDAAKFGVPQRRKRFILLASLVGDIKIPETKWASQTVRDAIGDLPQPKQILTKDGKPALV
ncbi:MAG: DNA cytosine methyltransferase, partial [Thermoplasmatota archaeon]